MLNIYIAHENGTYFANPIVYKCVYVDGGGRWQRQYGSGDGAVVVQENAFAKVQKSVDDGHRPNTLPRNELLCQLFGGHR